MKRRRLILMGAPVLLAAGLLLCWPPGPKEPVFEGKGLWYWLKENKGHRSQTENQAMKALKATGTNAAPFLLYQFTRSGSRWAAGINRCARKLGLNRFHLETDHDRVAAAGWGLYILGPDAAPALPVLATYLGDPLRGPFTGQAMGACGARALPFLRTALASTDSDAVVYAVDGFVELAKGTETAFPPIFGLLSHTNRGVRQKAVLALGDLESRSDLVVPALIGALSDADERVRYAAAYGLGQADEHAKPALPALRRMMTNSDPDLAKVASNAVQRIDPSALPLRRP